MNAPHVNLDVFKGDPLEYQNFMSVFDESVDSNLFNDQHKLTRLLQYTDGPAKAVIKTVHWLGAPRATSKQGRFTHTFWQ